MSSITRVMLGLPFAKGTNAVSRYRKGFIYTKARMPDGIIEYSLIRTNKKDRPGTLLKAVVVDGDRVSYYKPGKADYGFNRKSGKRLY